MSDIAATGAHLTKVARRYLEKSEKERVERLRRPWWIGYTRAKQILDRMEDLFVHPKMHRMPNLLIVGDTNNGKTMILNRFLQLHRAEEREEGEEVYVPVLPVAAPGKPDEAEFYERILDELYAPYKATVRASIKRRQAVGIMKRCAVRVLMIDEIHHILAGTPRQQVHFRNVIKDLGNELQIPIIAAGTRAAYQVIQADPQLRNRFRPAPLPRWEMGDEFRQLLASFERVIPLREPSQLSAMPLANKLLGMSAGTIGDLSSLLSEAAIKAIRTGQERIDAGLLESLDWDPPTLERWRAF